MEHEVKTKVGKTACIIVVLLLYTAVAVGIAYLLYIGGKYPSGTDTMGHIYKGNVMYQSIQKGNWYPLYDRFWYNGVQVMRDWAPVPVYVQAMCQALAQGSELYGYLVFVGLAFFLGAVVWLYIGAKKNRILLGAFLGILWFFMPNNLYMLFINGNFPHSLIMVLLPLLLYELYQFLFDGRWQGLAKSMVIFACMLLCDLSFAIMLLLALLLFLLFYRVICKEKGRALKTLVSLFIPFILIGFWFYASLKSSAVAINNTQFMADYFQDGLRSLHPLYRLKVDNTVYYFGLAAFLVAVFGAFCSKRKSMAGFWTALVLFFCTMSFMYFVFQNLPGKDYLWMLRYVSIALCLILFSFFSWTTLRRWILLFCCILLLADVVPSITMIYTGRGEVSAKEWMEKTANETLIDKAREITTQRAAIIDHSTLGTMAPYLLTDYNGKQIASSYGAEGQAAATANNIRQLNEAVAGGYYLYLFDRALELGNDTVLVKISQLKNQKEDIEAVTKGAESSGYKLVQSNSDFLLYHMDTYENFGTTCQYNGIGIGSSSSVLALGDPDIEEGDSINLNDYSYAQLSKYKMVYLAGFTYEDKEEAEELLKRLAKDGVRIVIEGDGIPYDEKSRNQEFLGVTCNRILFENGYPILYSNGKEYDCYLFDRNYREWQTVYFNGLKKTEGYLYDSGRKLSFLGTAGDENIYFIGLNLTMHYGLTKDENVRAILEHVTGQYLRELPDRKIVPLKVEYTQKEITIHSNENNVNTALAFHDIYRSTQGIYTKHNLTYVNEGTTKITLAPLYQTEGILVSILGIVLMVLFLIWVRRGEKRR